MVWIPFPDTGMWSYDKNKVIGRNDVNWDHFDMDFEKNHDNYLFPSEHCQGEDKEDV